MEIGQKEFTVGATIKFHTINGKDTHIIQGEVIAICNYQIAIAYGDVIKYHQEVLETNPTTTLTEDATVLEYILIKDVQGVLKPYTKEWIDAASFYVLDVSNDIDIRIYDVPDTETETILKLLRDNGYKALVQ